MSTNCKKHRRNNDEKIMLTLEAAQKFCLYTNTEKGREMYDFFEKIKRLEKEYEELKKHSSKN